MTGVRTHQNVHVFAHSRHQLSVVIPTFNRRERLARVLDRLDKQVSTTSGGQSFSFEVIVVSDGSTDGSFEMLEGISVSYSLRVIEQDNAGPAAARNAGIIAATSEIIIFLDDDVLPEPRWLAAHFTHHLADDNTVVVGPMLTPTDVELQPWIQWEQFQLEKQYASLKSGKPLYARQFYTGNASARKAALLRAGLFDTSLLRAEDIELARRMDLDGQQFVFDENAEAFHYAERSFDSWVAVARDYGTNDVLFAESGDAEVLSRVSRFFTERHLLQRVLVRSVVSRPSIAKGSRAAVAALASVADRTGLRDVNRTLLSALYGLHYYQGLADALGSRREFLRVIDGEIEQFETSSTDQTFVPWMVLEQTLGHITHSKNLHSLVPKIGGVQLVSIPVDDSLDGPTARIPGWSNWTVRAGVRARRGLARKIRDRSVPEPDALFVHSQVPAVLLGRWMRLYPTVVSLDATPKQYDSLGEFYDHEVGSSRVEALKDRMNRRCYQQAKHLITWSSWAKAGLVKHYGVDPSKVTVIAPGVDVAQWKRPETMAPRDIPRPAAGSGESTDVLRVLFVGGNLERKGGDVLLDANRILRADPDVPDFELHLVTASTVPDEPGVVVHAGLTANAPELIEQYHLADIFCLPTYGDCLPMVLAEAGAAGLPLISTEVAAIPSLVRDGETGRLVKPGDVGSLVHALGDLLSNPERRAALGAAARELVEQEHNAADNASALIDVLRAAASEH